MRAAWVIVVLAACGGGGVKDLQDIPPPQPAEATCQDAGTKLIELVVTGQDPAPPDDAVNKLIALVEKRCETDTWRLDARECFAKVKTIEDADVCSTKLSESQLANLSGDMRPPGDASGGKGDPGGAADADPGAGPHRASEGGAPPPPAPTRGARPNEDGADPCDGGE